MATRYNAALLQDDSQPHVYFSENDCPDAPCGCLGYQSPLEPIHQKLLDNGHHIFTIWTDYHEMGEGQSLPQVTRRMNLATLRRLQSQPEPIKTWWDCCSADVLYYLRHITTAEATGWLFYAWHCLRSWHPVALSTSC